MKMKKVFASVAAVAMAASMVSATAYAADWSQTSYADDDPSTVSIVSTSADGVVFTQTADGTAAKARITLDKVLANPDDVKNVYSGTWTVVYHGLAGTDIQGVGGGCYAATGNSTTYWLSPEYNEDGSVTWADEVSVEDSFKWLLSTSVPKDASTAEFVFMDWSNTALASNGVTIEIKDFKLFDKGGNEIAQLEYGSFSEATAEETEATEETTAEETTAAEETEAAVEETTEAVEEVAVEEPEVVEEVVVAEEPEVVEEVVTEAAPVADTTTPVAATGNAAAASIAVVMVAAGAAAVVSKRK